MPFKVLISYSWENSAERRALAIELGRVRGVKVLVDKDEIEPGDPIHPRISRMIEQSDCVVVLLTSEALQSREVLDEITRAHEQKKIVIPVVSEGTPLEALPWYLRDTNYISYNPRKFDEVAERLKSALEKRAN